MAETEPAGRAAAASELDSGTAAGLRGRDFGRPRAVVVTAEWGLHWGEVPSTVRTVAGALALTHDVDVVSLDDRANLAIVRPRFVEDGAFPVHSVTARPVLPRLTDLLTTALAQDAARGSRRAGTLPDLAARRLIALESQPSSEATDRIEALAPDVVVLAGIAALPIAEALPVGPGRPRVIIFPLLGTDERLASGAISALAERADSVVAVSAPEEELLRSSVGRRKDELVRRLRVPFPVNREASVSRLAGITAFGRYVLVISGWPDGDPSGVEGPAHDYLRTVVGPVSVAEVRHGRWLVSEGGRHFRVPWAPSRMNVWRLMAGAVATIDVRRQGPVARETTESLAFATPVVVPAGSVAAAIAEESSSGLWFATPGELVDQVRWLLEHEEERLVMGEQGRRWVEDEAGDMDRFVGECTELALLGASVDARPA